MSDKAQDRPEPSDREARSSRSRAGRSGWGRLAAAVQNGLEIARFGGLGEREPQPFDVVVEGEHHRLRRYYPERAAADRPAVLLVPPLMLTAEVWDVSPESSAVATLAENGADPWVVDFGSPESEEGGLARDLTDHVVAVSDAVESVRQATGRDVHLMGYSQGGMFAYQAAAYRRSEGIASLVTFGSPVDMHKSLPAGLPADVVVEAIERLGKVQASLMPSGIPAWATRLGFQLMDPVKTLQQRIDFARQLADRETLQKRDGMRRFMNRDGWVAFPGPALADVTEQLVAHNRLLQGGFVIDDRTITLADLTVPILAFLGTTDSIAPPAAVRAIAAAAPSAATYQVKLQAGHFGLVVGSRASEITWPTVAAWIRWCDEGGERPEIATRLEARRDAKPERTAIEDLAVGANMAWGLGRDLLEGAAAALGDRAGLLGRLAEAVAPQMPRLERLAELRSDTPISPGSVLQERADDSAEDTFFLFEGRAHSYAAANVRIDNVVRGFLHCGARHGQHVGVLMATRPSAVAATVALSRLGAVAVLLRPDSDLASQLALAPVDHLLSDPEHAEAARAASERDVLVLGGGGDPRALAPGLIDMEAIDPEQVHVPDWYTPNPGRAGELALILITGDGDRLSTSRVSNRRFATSAYGTASACALTARDTVYCCSPTHHATGILVCVGGALVSGARLAMASRFEASLDPQVFWEDVRRYGVNVVFYSGALLRALVNAPDRREERHHPIRLFAGSGMPKSLWKRLTRRFKPARVVEFFASTEGNAVLVNVTGEKIGSLGRPLPGAAELAVAAWDLQQGRLIEGRNGFVGRAGENEVGLLVAKVEPERGEVAGRPMRGLFEAGDAWLDTGDLVRRDAAGDYWLVDLVGDVIHARTGAIATLVVEDVITTELDFVDLVAVYGVQLPGQTHETPVAALTLRPGAKLDPVRLRRRVERRLSEPQRPVVVRVLAELPLTAGHRVRKRPLREQGLGLDQAQGECFWLAPDSRAYEPLDREVEAALRGTGAPSAAPAPSLPEVETPAAAGPEPAETQDGEGS